MSETERGVCTDGRREEDAWRGSKVNRSSLSYSFLVFTCYSEGRDASLMRVLPPRIAHCFYPTVERTRKTHRNAGSFLATTPDGASRLTKSSSHGHQESPHDVAVQGASLRAMCVSQLTRT